MTTTTWTELYREPVMLDSVLHRDLKAAVLSDYSVAGGLHAAFVASSEFPQAALEFPIVFIRAGEPGAAAGAPEATVSPVVLLGLSDGENLHVDGTRWDGRYIPAVVRRYPFLTAKVPGAEAPGVLIDSAWAGFSSTAGDPLFHADGSATETLAAAIGFLRSFDAEVQQTKAFCSSLVQLDILREMKADATLPGGASLSVDGFFTVDENRLRALPDSSVLGLHRSGMLALLQAHLLSLNNLRHLVERKIRRAGAAPPAAR